MGESKNGDSRERRAIISFLSLSLFSRRQNTETLIHSLRKHFFVIYRVTVFKIRLHVHLFTSLLWFAFTLFSCQAKEIFYSYFDTGAVDRINFDAEIVEGLKSCEYTCRDVRVSIRDAVGSDKVSHSQFPYSIVFKRSPRAINLSIRLYSLACTCFYIPKLHIRINWVFPYFIRVKLRPLNFLF